MNSLRNAATALLLALVGTLSPLAPSAAADTVKLKDGTSLVGKIENETADYLFVVIKIGELSQRKLVARSEIKEIVRDAPAATTTTPATTTTDSPVTPKPDSAEPAAPDQAKPDAAPSAADGATKITVVTLEEEVGPYMNADALHHSIELIPKNEKPDILVIKINSGGGALLEVPKLMKEIQKNLKKDYRVVGWIESAISAAAMTAMNMEELYFFDRGHLGGAVAFSMTGPRQAKAMTGVGLAQVLELGQQIAKNGRYDPLVIHAMQEFFDLSCNIDEAGRVTWQNDTKGQFIVNTTKPERILTLNSIDAKKYGISKGTADTLPELARLLGVTEWVETGKAADAYQQEFRANVKKAEVQIDENYAKYQIAFELAKSAQDMATRKAKVGEAKGFLDRMEALVRRAPSLEVYKGLTKDVFVELRDELDKLLRRGPNTGG